MSIFANGEEVICINSRDAMGLLVEGKTYIVTEQGAYCNCCIGVGIGVFCYQSRFRRPEIISDKESYSDPLLAQY